MVKSQMWHLQNDNDALLTQIIVHAAPECCLHAGLCSSDTRPPDKTLFCSDRPNRHVNTLWHSSRTACNINQVLIKREIAQLSSVSASIEANLIQKISNSFAAYPATQPVQCEYA